MLQVGSEPWESRSMNSNACMNNVKLVEIQMDSNNELGVNNV